MLEEGKLEVIQDRRHSRDDRRGVEQSLSDNREIRNVFNLLFETVQEGKGGKKSEVSWKFV